jgi:hypothetical protein
MELDWSGILGIPFYVFKSSFSPLSRRFSVTLTLYAICQYYFLSIWKRFRKIELEFVLGLGLQEGAL